MSRTVPGTILSSATLIALPLVCACGYSFGTELSQEGIRTVAVRVVDNETFRHRLEIPLTRQINTELVNLTDLVPSSESAADAVLVVEIVDAYEGTLVIGNPPTTAPVQEGALVVLVNSRLVRDGRDVVQRQILDRAEFRVPIGESLESATAEMVFDMARKIVLSLETDF